MSEETKPATPLELGEALLKERDHAPFRGLVVALNQTMKGEVTLDRIQESDLNRAQVAMARTPYPKTCGTYLHGVSALHRLFVRLGRKADSPVPEELRGVF